LEETESRLQFELEAEQNQEIAAKDQVQTLTVFNDFVTKSEEHPERIKALLPRFVDYVVFHEEAKGEGQLEVALFPNPVENAPDLVFEDGVNGSGPRFAGGSALYQKRGQRHSDR
jgi:membrane-bound lytic murein transglycosylase